MNREELAAVMRGVPWVSLWAGPAPTVYNDEPDYLGMADAVLQHLASQRQEQGMSEVCVRQGCIRDALPYESELELVAVIKAKDALVARLGESLKWDHNTQGPNHVRSSCDVCALLAELAPTTGKP